VKDARPLPGSRSAFGLTVRMEPPRGKKKVGLQGRNRFEELRRLDGAFGIRVNAAKINLAEVEQGFGIHSVAAVVEVIRRSRADEVAFVADRQQVVAVQGLDEAAHLADPVEEQFAAAGDLTSRLVGEFPSEDGGLLEIVTVRARVAACKHALHPIAVGHAGGGSPPIEFLDVAGDAEPFQIKTHPAQVVPVVHQGKDDTQPVVPGRGDQRVKTLKAVMAPPERYWNATAPGER